MCRLAGVVSSEATEFALVLRNAPRSLASLSRQHPDGWGIAVYERVEATSPSSWNVHKGIDPAVDDAQFHAIAAGSRGHILISHVRQKTVGPTRLENTHPFERDGWVFAHNGTIKELDVVRAETSSARRSEIQGDTDSEQLFAHFLTRLDEAGVLRPADEPARTVAAAVIEEAARRLREANVGAFNFLLSDGQTCFAHRCGRTLFVLERVPGDPVLERRGALVTKWTERRHAVLIASERLTEEPWQEVPEGTFLRVDRDPVTSSVLRGPTGRAA